MEPTVKTRTARRLVRSARRKVAVVAAVGVAVTAAPAVALADPAAAQLAAATVLAGDARFVVLSPTLIRTEYAGDGKFTDQATFNAIGRTAFRPTPYTARVSGDLLTVSTSAMTLTYEKGSGPFSAKNLSVQLKAGAQPVTAAPWQHLICAAGALCEAEDLASSGVSVANDHSGYGGSGFLAGFQGQGNRFSADVDVATAGSYQFDLRYANAVAGDGQHTTRTLSLSVDGGANQTVSLPPTDTWDTWALVGTKLSLGAGRHTITLTRAAADSGNVNVDSVALVPPDAPYPSAAARAVVDCPFGTTCEAEVGRPAGSAGRATNHQGFSGNGFLAELNQGAGLTEPVVNVPADGTYAVQVRYANGVGGDGLHQDRTATVSAGGATQQLTLPATKDWDTWGTASATVPLKAGANTLVLGCPDAVSCHVNLDTVSVTAAGAPAPAPHLALGGYRRGLDGFNGDNGAPDTTPGLLNRDGWYLLDDTTSALYDPATRQVTPRPGHGGQSYQDGYLFGYGHDYQQGLGDLATLTGPPELLPRWVYGVWYSEYFDRTAADYRDTILPHFRADNVPLDVLVTDTDFKAPDTWDGWSMDRTKFPDPKGFFDWSASQGLHNTLNIHPSIKSSDPKFAQAQATAKGKLASCGGDCYTFDWGDPDQLKAYLDLHQEMESQGNDFWWLDWCCDNSQSSLDGVTPDAWINQQYATDADKTVGRGFVISRAYGSLQAGGYSGPGALPTGPWADKRSTIHFTGDTSSTWGTLKAEVGYTPGEAAATGMSAISHDIGGHNDTTGLPGSETYVSGGQTHQTAKLPDDMYARWVQLGTFQPVDRLHSNHSDRLPWQYGAETKASAEKFLTLREDLVPYTYTQAQLAATTGVPVVRPTYLQYPEEENAYATAGSEYLYGPDMLVAPVTTPGSTATTSVWFPPGQWTDYFTGQTYAGGTTQNVTTGLGSMPVFVRAGGIVATRTNHVANDVQNPLDQVTLTVAAGAPGAFTLYEDNGTNAKQSSTTAVHASGHSVRIDGARGSFAGQLKSRVWTVSILGATAPAQVTADGRKLPSTAWHWDAAAHKLTVELPRRDVRSPVTVTY
jgi:hypothetical protein